MQRHKNLRSHFTWKKHKMFEVSMLFLNKKLVWRCYCRKVSSKKISLPKLFISALAWNERRYSREERRIHIFVLFSVLHRLSTRQTVKIITVLGSALWIHATGQVFGFSFASPLHKVARKGKHSQPACCSRLPSPGVKRGSRPFHFFHFCP